MDLPRGHAFPPAVEARLRLLEWISDNGGTGGPLTVTEQFARSMSLKEAMDPRNLLCYGMNGVDLPTEHGAPVRLIAPGWYGVANVKWLKRIEVRDGRFRGPVHGARLRHGTPGRTR